MVENLGRKLTLILSLIAIAVLALKLGGFRMGLDLQGGTRLVYSFDIEKAVEEGKIRQEELLDPTRLMNEVISIFRQRIDPQGVREPMIRTEGQNPPRLVIELPGSAAQPRQAVSVALAEEIDPTAREIQLADTEEVENLPATGGLLAIGDEVVRYGRRLGPRLLDVSRGYQESPRTGHAAGATADLMALDPWRAKLEDVGSMEILLAAQPTDLEGTDLTAEMNKAKEWVEANSDAPISDYNAALQANPATARLLFFPHRQTKETVDAPKSERLSALIRDEDSAYHFTGSDLRAVYASVDEYGLPAVGFQLSGEGGAGTRFGEFTDEHVGERMGIVINDEIATMPNISERLPGGGVITGGRGGFKPEEVQDLVTVLRSGSLRLEPKFEQQESVGATLGEEYVRRGFMSVGLGLALVLAFMVVYYRRLGVLAGISLLVNLLLLTGALAFLQATLTLPGVAGIILTVGMAVDANILIYERIREEALRGRKPLQAAKDGFGNALSTIVDANLTTLITGIILYKFGTGPVRGFATTLSIGILTSMFSALVVTRVLVHLQLEKGIDRFSMARLVGDTNISFLSKARAAMIGSLVLIVGGLALYSTLSEDEKLGIDFLGGTTMTVRTADPHTKDEVKDLVAGIESAEVKEIRNSAMDGGFTRFRITAKGSGLAEKPEASGDGPEKEDTSSESLTQFQSAVEEALREVLQLGPIEELQVTDGRASGVLYFEREHSAADVVTALAEAGVADAQVEPAPATGGVTAFRFDGAIEGGRSVALLRDRLKEVMETSEDSLERSMALASPVDEVNAVGAQVVAELRDKAIFAILLSLFAAVMYIRVRFAEYSFGFAAVIALTHDVLITLGALALADKFLPFIDTEINLPMIAAFLTIIGYSLNDTIVVFDRVRENLPRMKGSLAEIIDRSINQTLSRTVLTSVTTLITIGLLLIFNAGSGNVLEGFAFALLVGVLVGTYSSIFIASPALLWLESRRQKGLGPDDPSRKGSKVEVPATV